MLRRFITFCGVGGINTLAGLAVILLLSEAAGLHYMLANLLGYAFGLCLAFVLHKTITFQDKGKLAQALPQFKKFLLIFVFAYALQFVFLIVMVDLLHTPKALSQILAVALYTVISFLGNNYLTFNKREGGL